MNQIQQDALSATLMNGTWLVLLIEYICFDLNVALPLACVWGLVTMVLNIRILARYAIKIEYR